MLKLYYAFGPNASQEKFDPTEFNCHFQPIFALEKNGDHRLSGYETLARHLQDSTPESFINELAANNHLPQLDLLMLEKACLFIKVLEKQTGQPLPSNMAINVNLSAQTLADPAARENIERCLKAYSILPGQINFEILEEAFINHFTPAAISALHDAGHKIYIDDYGTGASDLKRVGLLNPSGIKIAKELLDKCTKNEDYSPLAALFESTKFKGKTFVLEGAERNIAARIDLEGLDVHIQSHAFSMPLAHSAALSFFIQAQLKPGLQGNHL